MRTTSLLRFLLRLAAVFSLAAAAGLPAAGAAPVKFDIPPQAASAALLEFSRQAGVGVLFSFDELAGIRTNGLAGEFEVAEGLRRLIAGTRLQMTQTGERRFVVTVERPGRISGTVTGPPGGRPLAGVTVAVAGSTIATQSGRSGRFLLPEVPAGSHAITLGAPGLQRMRIVDVQVEPGQRLDLKPVVMEPADGDPERLDEVLVSAGGLVIGGDYSAAAVQLDAVVVTPSHFGVTDDAGLATATLTRGDIETLPQLGEDLFRAIGRLPGLATTDYSAKFWVRGAPNHQVLTRLDGATLLEPYHIKDVDGALSIVDIETVARLDLLSGGFTAEFGDRLGGVLLMETETPARPRRHTTLGLSLTGVRATDRGTFAGGKGSWLLSGRMGYPDLALEATGDGGTAKPRYYDLFGKVGYRIADGQTLALHFLHSDDRLTVRNGDRRELHSSYGNDYVWARWRGEFGERLKGEGVLSYAELDWHRRGKGVIAGILPFDLTDDRTLSLATLRQDWSLLASERALLRGGFEIQDGEAGYDYHRLRHLHLIRDGELVVEPRRLDRELDPGGTAAGAYTAVRFQPQARLTLEPGLRYDRGDYGGGAGWSPRLNAALDLGRATVRAAWGRYRQVQGLHEIGIADGESTIQPDEVAEQRVLGLERRFATGLNVRAEAYQRITRNPRPHGQNLIEVADSVGEVLGDRTLIRPARAEARGVELILESRGRGALEWSATYAWARTAETVGGREVPRERDQRHTLYLDVSYRPNPRWQFSAAWQFHTGWPTTEEIFTNVTLNDGRTVSARSFGPIYGARLPDYHRLDLRATRMFVLRDSTLRIFLDVFNAYDRANVMNYISSPEINGAQVTTRRTREELFPLLPSIGVIWDF